MASGKRQLGETRGGVGVSRTLRYRSGGGRLRRGGGYVAISVAMVAVAPLWLFVGYLLERTWGRPHGGNRLAFEVTRHPIAIALSAPMRFLADRVLPSSRRARRSGGDFGPPSAGDREPRRPKPTLPSDAVALTEPRS